MKIGRIGLVLGFVFLLMPLIAQAVANDAQCVSSTMPTTLNAGESRSIAVTFKNTGTNTWQDSSMVPTMFYAATIRPTPTGTSITPTGTLVSGSVAPGQNYTYTINITAPTTLGTYSGTYQMVQQNVDWFGDLCGPSTVTVVTPPPAAVNNAQCVSSTMPSTMTAGQTQTVSVTFKNSGTTVWHDLYAAPNSYYAATLWPVASGISITPVSGGINGTINPGENYTYILSVTAPTTPGTYSGAYRMVQQNVDWFGDTCGPAAVQVTAAPPSTPAPTPSTPTSVYVPTSPNVVWTQTGQAPAAAPEWHTFPFDIEITGITVSTDWKKGATGDYCFAAYRDQAPIYAPLSGAYADLWCLNTLQFGSDGQWSRHADFTQTPLYIPANTKFSCNTSGGSTALTAGTRTCTMEYKQYVAGDPRYRILRIPYQDTMLNGQADLFFPSSYVATADAPLHIKGYQVYDGVVGTDTACVIHKNSSGAVVAKDCLPTTTRSLVANSEPAAYKPLDWTIPATDTVTADCTVNGTPFAWDCAFYLVTEIPAAVTPNPENVFRDYGNVPHPAVENWCTSYVDNYIVDAQAFQLCGYVSCTRDQKIANCVAAFAPASCIKNNSCKPAVSTPPPPVTTPVPYTTPTNSIIPTTSGASSGGAGASVSSFVAPSPVITTNVTSHTVTTVAVPPSTATSLPKTSNCPVLSYTLVFGDTDAKKGGDVSRLQIFFLAQGLLPAGTPTGYFGALTRAALQAYQKQHGIVSSGMPTTTGYGAVGPKTRAALMRCAN